MECATGLRFEEALTIADERLDAADVLARSPHRAESIHILVRALSALELAIEGLHAKSASRVIGENELGALRGYRERLSAAPMRDSRLSREDLALQREARKFAVRLRSRLKRATLSRRSLAARRVGLALLGTLVCAVGILIVQLRARFETIASASYSSAFLPERATDGDPTTEWLAPEGADGWLELRYAKPLRVSAVRVVNAHNGPFDDRATQELEIELYRGEQRLHSVRYTFARLESSPEAQNIPVQGVGVTRVRLVARSHYGEGAGLAEVEIIEGISH